MCAGASSAWGLRSIMLSHRMVTIVVSCPRMGLRCRGSTSGPRGDLTLALDVGLQEADYPRGTPRRGQASTTKLRSPWTHLVRRADVDPDRGPPQHPAGAAPQTPPHQMGHQSL